MLVGQLQGRFEDAPPAGGDRQRIVQRVAVAGAGDLNRIDARRDAGREGRDDLRIGNRRSSIVAGILHCRDR